MQGVRRITGRVLLPDAQIAPATLIFQGATLTAVEPRRPGEALLDGLLVPGLINAHTHLELAHLGQVDGSSGLPSWIRNQFARRGEVGQDTDQREARIAARALKLSGTAAVSDVVGGTSTSDVLREAGLSGVVQRERLGQDRGRRDAGVQEAPSLHRVCQGTRTLIVERPAAHAPYSTHPELARATLAPHPLTGAVPGSVHLGEDPAERRFLQHGDGPFAELLDAIGVQWSVAGPCDGPVDWLRQIGALGPGTLAVHGVDLTGAERQALADHGVALALCVRSNLHITGRAPDIADLLARGVRLCLGTDGLVSCPDQDVLAELPALARLAPDVPPVTWLDLATRGGAQALGLQGLGVFTVSACPGVVQLDADAHDLISRPPQRRWLVQPGVPDVRRQELT